MSLQSERAATKIDERNNASLGYYVDDAVSFLSSRRISHTPTARFLCGESRDDMGLEVNTSSIYPQFPLRMYPHSPDHPLSLRPSGC